MKIKNWLILFLVGISFVGILFGSVPDVLAQGASSGIPGGSLTVEPYQDDLNSVQGNVSARETVIKYINFGLSFLGILCIIMIIYAGFMYIISFGDDGTMEKAKKIIIYCIIGILVIMLSFALVNTVIRHAPQGTQDRNDVVTVTPSVSSGGESGTSGSSSTGDGSFITNNNLVLNSDGIKNFGNGYSASLDSARSGITFSYTQPAECRVDFGDGTSGIVDTITSPDSTIAHIYGAVGKYMITLNCRNVEGVTSTETMELVIGGISAQIQVSRSSARINESVSFSGAASNTLVGTLASYSWECRGGGGCFPNFQGPSFTATFSEAGAYTIYLTVTNNLGDTAESSVTVNVSGDKPVADFTLKSTGNSLKPGEFLFDAGKSLNLSGTNSGLVFDWDIDGETKTTSSPTFTYEFNEAGSKSITLKVTQRFSGEELVSEVVTKTQEVEKTIGVDFIFQ